MKSCRLFSWLPSSVPEFLYTVVLKPKPLRSLANALIKTLIPRQIEVQGIRLLLNQEDPVVSGALSLGCYEQFDLQVFAGLLKPGMCVLDVGANIGLYSAVAARQVTNAGLVVAVEPEPRNCQLIEETKKLNGFENITVVRKALADSTGPGRLFLCKDNQGDHRIYDNTKTRPALTIACTTLDDLCEELGLHHVDVLKMDIQGAEGKALKGMPATLGNNPDIRVMMELWPWGLAQAGENALAVLKEIRRLGFEVFRIDRGNRKIRRVTDDGELVPDGSAAFRYNVNLLLQRDKKVPGQLES